MSAPSAYIDRAGLDARFGAQSVDALAGPAGAEADARVARACADASALMDAYLRARYRTPLPASSPLLAALAADVARFLLYGVAPPESVRLRYQDALARLRDLAEGRMTLEGAAPALGNDEAAEGSSAQVRFVAAARAAADGGSGVY